jgi:acylphosphatase
LGAARRYEVVGFVENLPDGRVHVVVEGIPSELDAFLDDIATDLAGHIRSVQVEETDASGGFDGFRIKIY